jgi:hypothetical protein
MKMKAKQASCEAIIEKFSSQSCKSAKYAKTTIKKKDAVEPQKQRNDVSASIEN